MRYSASIRADDRSGNLFKALKSERSDHKTDRALHEISQQDGHILIGIKAKDATALRASLNSISKLISVFEKAEGI